MIRDELRRLLTEAVERAMAAGDLPRVAVPEPGLEHPPNVDLGDYASAVAMKMARSVGRAPLEVAGAITAHLEPDASVAVAETAPPGFINLHLSIAWLQEQIDEVLRQGASFGAVPLGLGERVQVEHVSANPTGPLHVGAGRNAALGDTLANVLELCSYDVEREYYVNNAGSRIDALAQSVYARYCQQHGRDEPLPADGYPGEYIEEIARQLGERHGTRFLEMPREQALAELGKLATEQVIEWIRHDLTALNVEFERWFYEQELFDSGLFEQAMRLLRENGHLAERDGAIWFATSDLGEDKDNVLIRSNGQPTYFASDVAYHYDKFLLRKFDKVINVWAADHQGHVPRMKAMARALGVEADRLVIIVYQLVNLVRDGKPIRMEKRTGTYVTLREALDEVGPDALRFFLVSRSADAMMDLDLDLAKKQANENPVYYVQYAHARIASILRRAGDTSYADGDVRLLEHPAELALIRKMLLLPELVETAAVQLAPHHLPFYAQDLARAFHTFYDECRVVSDDAPLTAARLKLVAACKLVLANTLTLIGVSTPEQM
jgi:arginyl-tRNA synthetase